MDATLNRLARRALTATASAAALGAVAAAHAQAAADPTQPPAAYAPKLNANAQAPREQRLQAVIRRADGSRMAVIGGQAVTVGESIGTDGGPARVAAIFDDRVVLVRGTARETLALHPTITSKPGSSSAAPSASASASASTSTTTSATSATPSASASATAPASASPMRAASATAAPSLPSAIPSPHPHARQ